MTQMIRISYIILALILLAACSAGASAPPPLAVELKASEFHYDAPALTARVGQSVTLRYVNVGVLDHSLALDEWGIETESLRPGQAAEVAFTPRKAGAYTYYCAVPGHAAAGMVGTLTVDS